MNTPTILLGAFDRHNFGDLLFPHLAAALLPGSRLIFAGLAERDLRPFGGHRTHALARLAAEFGNAPCASSTWAARSSPAKPGTPR
jgi:hypothetical protein